MVRAKPSSAGRCERPAMVVGGGESEHPAGLCSPTAPCPQPPSHAGNTMMFKCKPRTKFEKVFKAYCAKKVRAPLVDCCGAAGPGGRRARRRTWLQPVHVRASKRAGRPLPSCGLQLTLPPHPPLRHRLHPPPHSQPTPAGPGGELGALHVRGHAPQGGGDARQREWRRGGVRARGSGKACQAGEGRSRARARPAGEPARGCPRSPRAPYPATPTPPSQVAMEDGSQIDVMLEQLGGC